MHVWIKDIAIVLVAAADLSVVVVLVAIAATLADHRHQTSLTVVLRQKRRFVTHCKTQDQPYVSSAVGLITRRSTMLAKKIITGLVLLAIATTGALANAPGGAYIQCDGSSSSPVRCTPDSW
jgi:multisubunit Na+/H+ antiporter MnhB subunit